MPGFKESRYAHLLAGEPEDLEPAENAVVEVARLEVRAEHERIASLEREVASLKSELAVLRGELRYFRQQFE